MTRACEDDLFVIVFFNSGESQLEVNSQKMYGSLWEVQKLLLWKLGTKHCTEMSCAPLLEMVTGDLQKLNAKTKHIQIYQYVSKLFQSVEKMARTASCLLPM